jgi:hypothetical protein
MLDELLIRPAGPADERAVWRLAALDGASPPPAPLLIAEDAGVPVAAVSEADGRAIADPFRQTAAIVAMLHSAAAGRRKEPATRAGWLRRAPAMPAVRAALASVQR